MQAQLDGNKCCFHINAGAGLSGLRAPPHAPLHPQPVALPLVFTHAFPGVTVSPGLADGNVLSSSVFIGWREHGKTRRVSSALQPRLSRPQKPA